VLVENLVVKTMFPLHIVSLLNKNKINVVYLTKHSKHNENYHDVSVKKMFRYRKNRFRMNVKPFACKPNSFSFIAKASGFIAKAFMFTSMLRSKNDEIMPHKASNFWGIIIDNSALFSN